MKSLELSLGDRLRFARQHAGLEQTQLAELLGLSRQSISNYERDIRTPNAATVLAWSIHTQTTVESLERGQERVA